MDATHAMCRFNVIVLLRYTTVYRDLGDTGIVVQLSTISIEVSWVSHNTNVRFCHNYLLIHFSEYASRVMMGIG